MKRNEKNWIHRVLLMSITLLVVFGSISFAEEPVSIGTQSPNNNPSNWQPRNGYGMGHYFSGKMRSTIAKTLNMSEEQVYLERLKGKSIADLAKEKGVSIEKIMTEMKATKKAHVDQLLKEKKITQEQAKIILDRMDANLKLAIERKGAGPRGRDGYKKGKW